MANWYDNIPTPVDFNGNEVPPDTRELVYGGETRSVLRIAYSVDLGRWVADLENTEEHPFLTTCTLPDSWELLENDARNGLCEYFGMGDAEDCKGCRAFGNRLSLGCNSVMACDIVNRAKALAGVAE